MLGSYRDLATKSPNDDARSSEFSVGIEGIIQHRNPANVQRFSQEFPMIPRSNMEEQPYSCNTVFGESSGQPVARRSNVQIGDYALSINWASESNNKIVSIRHREQLLRITPANESASPSTIALGMARYSGPIELSYYVDTSINAQFGSSRPNGFHDEQIKRLRDFYGDLVSGLPELNTHAFSPLRSEPKRTYDPVQVMRDSSGKSIPMILSQAWRKNEDQWARLTNELSSFGKASGLFRAVSIRELTPDPSDPFQVIVDTSGDDRNLADVGYGVSQILPIIIQILSNPLSHRILIQQPEVHLHPRAQAAFASFLVHQVSQSSQHFIVETHSDQIIDRLRVEVRRGRLTPSQVSLGDYIREWRNPRFCS